MKLEVNSQGFFRVKLPDGKYLMDSDLMLLMSSSHRSKIMTYGSEASALSGYAHYKALRERTGYAFSEVVIEDDFKPAN